MIDDKVFYNLTYGLFVLTAKEGVKQNGCIINTAIQIASDPVMIGISVNKNNYTHDMILKTGEFNLSVLSEDAPFSLFQSFGFRSGRDADKFDNKDNIAQSANGIYYLNKYANSFVS